MDPNQFEYVVFDVETTGLSASNGDRILEIAGIKIKNGQMIDTFESFINPEREIPEEAKRIHNISEDMIANAPTRNIVLPQFVDFIGRAHLVGHNVKFDADFLTLELSLIQKKLKEEICCIDTLKMAKRLLPQLTHYKLAHIAQYFGAEIEETHRALADVELTVRIFQGLLAQAHRNGLTSIQNILKEFSINKPVYKIESAEQNSLF